MKILIIEDDKDILSFLKFNLEAEGFVVDVQSDGKKGEDFAFINEYNLIILDLNLPSKNGDLICKTLREQGKTMPILILSVENDMKTKVDLLNSGADDYVLKPFSFMELLARIKILTRQRKENLQKTLRIRDLELDSDKQILFYKNRKIYLTRKEYSITELLLNNYGKIVSRALILENAWDSEANIFSKSVETHILNLRRKIDKDNPREVIKTISGRGYMIGD
ncbi:MAG: response regulator transcription factor [Candidatus Paceibacterota bacterium]